MDDIPDFILYIFLTILIIILFLFILKYKYHWVFKLNIGKSEGFDNEKEKIINEVVKNVEHKIDEVNNNDNNNNDNIDNDINNKIKKENNEMNEKETKKKEEGENKKENNEKEDKQTIEELINQKVKEKIEELQKQNEIIERNNGEKIIKKHYYPYNVMLNEPIGRLKQSKLMIDQLVNKNLERYYSYVKPITYDDKEYKNPFNANTFCIRCDSKDQEYSSYFYADPLEYENDKLDENKTSPNEGEIKAYNV